MNDEMNKLKIEKTRRMIRSDSGTSGEIERGTFGLVFGTEMTSEEIEASCLSNDTGISFKREESDELY